MKNHAWVLALASVLVGALRAQTPGSQRAPPADGVWQDVSERSIVTQGERRIVPNAYRTVRLDAKALQRVLARVPLEFTDAARVGAVEFTLPLPNGKFGRFKIVESPMVAQGPGEPPPDFKTYSGVGVDDPTAITRFDFSTRYGFHAIILSESGTIYIDPYATGDVVHYLSYFKRDYPRGGEDVFHCQVKDFVAARVGPGEGGGSCLVLGSYGFIRFYQFAMAATGEYTAFFRLPGDTDPQAKDRALAAIKTTVNRVNSIYGRDLGVRLVLLSDTQERQIIYTDATTDPYTNPPGTVGINNENQANLDTVIGSANYDIGHVVGVGTGGLATRPSGCQDGIKAKGSTGRPAPTGDPFDVDYVAHEVGHQLNAQHTFNDNTNGSCGGTNRAAGSAYEPGSGSTIMAYAGICGAADLQPNSGDYFHVKSVEDLRYYVHDPGGSGSTCGIPMPTGNTIITTCLPLTHTIPSRTPFRLYMADFSDPDPGDGILYNWEEFDLGLPSPPEGDAGDRPIFRSYKWSTRSDRILPSLQYILNNANNPPATYQCGTMANPKTCLTGETLPVTTRTMFFRLILRDNNDGVAIFDDVTINIRADSGPFAVTQPNSGISWTQGSQQTVTWNVANTNAAPVTCANVKITLSTDGGNSFNHVLAESTANDGSETIVLPNVSTAQARIKVEAVGNIFFDISDANFSLAPPMVSNTLDSGPGSLRQAIIDTAGGSTAITFNIPGSGVHTINVQSPLPPLNGVTLDGRSQGGPGYTGPPLIELNGTNAVRPPPNQAVPVDGLVSSGGPSLITGITINRFTGNGILVSQSSNNSIQGCYIGTSSDGSARAPNGQDGIRLLDAPNNLIGGLAAGAGNLISGNGGAAGGDGIKITGSTASGNIVQGNFIGTNAAGNAPVYNFGSNIHIIGAPNTLIGRDSEFAAGRNVISGAETTTNSNGILIEGSTATGTVIQGNYIGTDATGSIDLGNRGSGILINNVSNTTIGGVSAANFRIRNIIAGNNSTQIVITGSGATNTLIHGNYVGLNAAGNARIEINGFIGIRIESAGNIVRENVISGNSLGIDFNQQDASNNVVQGNLIGTDATGTSAIPNNAGINILRGENNLIGGTSVAARNVISGNTGAGIQISGDNANPARNNLVQGNWIGTNAAGNAALGNGAGVLVNAAQDVTIGGAGPGAGNVISGSVNSGAGSYGVLIANGVPVTGNKVQGNLIGTNAAGTAALGNVGNGVQVGGSGGGALIGGTGSGARNVIAANGQYGILLTGGGNLVQGNFIGTDVSGTADLHNTLSGISVGGSNNMIGGPAQGAGNLIAFNGVNSNYTGVSVNGINNAIRGNSIFSNTGLGIDIAGLGVTPNDDCDPDGGFGNNSQNFPVLSSATSSGSSMTVQGTLNSTPNTQFTIEFFANSACDPSGNGEGQTFLGSRSVTTDASCNVSFAFNDLPGAAGFLTATATDPAGNTSEFCACRSIASPPIPQSIVSRKAHGGVGSFEINLALTQPASVECRSGGASNAHQIVFSFANPVTFTSAAVTSGSGSVASAAGSGTQTITVNLTNVPNAQTIAITLGSVSNGTITGDLTVPMSLLLGDTNGNGAVSAADVSQTKAQSGQAAGASNFRSDVNASGAISAADISQVKAQSGTSLP